MTPNRRNRFRTLLAALLVLVFAAGGAMAANRPNAAIVAEEIEWCWPWSDEESRHDLGGAPPTFTFPATNLNVIVELALGADLTANPDSWVWTDVSTYVRHQDRIVIHRGRGDEWTEVGPSQASLTLDNRDGRFTRLNVFGTYYGQLQRNTPLRIRVDMKTGAGPQTRFTGYVTKWPPRWDKSGNNKWTSITADGIFRRLGQGDPLRSPLYRTMAGVAPGDYVPYAYWPMEDGSRAVQIASGLPSGAPITPNGSVSFAADTGLAGSEALPTFAAGAKVVAAIPSYTATDRWAYQWFMKINAKPSVKTTYFEAASTGGNVKLFRLSIDPLATAVVQLELFDAAGVEQGEVNIILDGSDVRHPSESQFFGQWATLVVASSEGGGGILNGWLGLSVTPTFSGSFGVEVAGANGATTSATLFGGNGSSIGHLGVYTATAFDPINDGSLNAAAMNGYTGEQAGERIRRLCREEQLPSNVTGTSSAAMGGQTTTTLLNLLREAEAADLGVLYETLDGRAGYRTNADRYNRNALLTLDYALKQIQDPWVPEDDDQKLRNDITVSRPSGSSARAQDDDSIAREGRVKQPHTANVETDSQLTEVGGWLRHLGIWDELRFPQVGFQLHRHTSLINAWLAQDLLTHRLDILNLPTPVPATTAQALEGYTETIGSRDWEVVANLAPSGTYTVAVYDDGLSRYGAASTVLAAAINATATSVAVTATGETWITTATYPAEFPINVTIGGLTYSCTAITGTSPNYTLTLVRLATDKAHASAAAVAITDTGRYGL